MLASFSNGIKIQSPHSNRAKSYPVAEKSHVEEFHAIPNVMPPGAWNNFVKMKTVRKKNDIQIYCKNSFTGHYDRTWRTDDGDLLYGIDADDGKTDWYSEDDNPAGSTDTPTDEEQAENDSLNDGYDAKCPFCRGTGYDPYDGGQCDECGGTGEKW